MPTYAYPEWLARNASRAYPLRETSPRLSHRGLRLPDDLLADLSAVGAGTGPGNLCLQSICLTPRLVSAVFGDAVGNAVAIATAVVTDDISDETNYQEVDLMPLGDFEGRFAGRAVFGPAHEAARYAQVFIDAGSGTHFFSPDDCFETRCCLQTGPMPIGSLNGLEGEVDLQLGGDLRGAASQLVQPDGEPIRVLTLFLRDAQKFLSPCDQTGQSPCGAAKPIRSINGVVGSPNNGSIQVRFLGFTSSRQVDHSVRVLQLQTALDYCPRRELPDDDGRLPPDYDNDLYPTPG